LDRYWLQHYPANVPHDINPSEYASLRELIDKGCLEHADKPAYSNMGTTLTFRDQSATTAAIDLLLDNVRVTAAAAATAPRATNPAITQAPSGMGSLSLAGAPGDFTIRMTASQPGSYVLERSEDLSHWEFVTEKQVSQPGPIEFRDSGNAPAPQQAKPRMFYRVGRQPGATY
jgi:hypothetical protein